MRRQRTRPFDAAYKRLFSHPRMAADLVRLLGDNRFDTLDLDRMERLASEHILDNLRTRREDMPWLARYKEGTGWPPGTGVVFQFEFQSRPDPDMLERMVEYWALQRRQLRRSRKALGPDGEPPLIVPVVVHTGRGQWTSPRSTATPEGGNEPPDLFEHFAYRLVDVKSYAGDHASDGNLCRAGFALDAASAENVAAALGRAAELLGEASDGALSRSFELWCRGVLGRRLAKRLPSLANLMEEPLMLAQTLQDWEERNIQRGREEGKLLGREEGIGIGMRRGVERGREEGVDIGMRRGREEERRLLCGLAARRFGDTTANALRPLLGSLRDEAGLKAAGALIVDSGTGVELLDGMRRLARSNDSRA